MRKAGLLLGVLGLLGCSSTPAAPAPVPEAGDASPAPDVMPEAGAPEVADAAGSAGCGHAPRYPAGTSSGGITSGGRQRSFEVHLPPGYDPTRSYPLVVLLHGGLGTGSQMEASSLMSPIADREGFVVVYPDGVSRSWNAGTCCGPPVEQNIDDVGFIADLLGHLESELCLDRRRFYAGGMSNGAMMSHRLGCALSERLAAIAPVAGTNLASPCTPARPMPIMHIHGRQDRHVPWEGGVGCGISGVPYTSVPDSTAGWAVRNRCGESVPSLWLQQGDGRCELQGACPAGAEVVLCTITGGGHAWPAGGPRELVLPACTRAGEGGQSTTFLASEQMWTFFAAHTRN